MDKRLKDFKESVCLMALWAASHTLEETASESMVKTILLSFLHFPLTTHEFIVKLALFPFLIQSASYSMVPSLALSQLISSVITPQ